MELRVLRYFLAVSEEGSVTRAAKRLHMTQPTLSRQLMELEKELSIPLFARGKKALHLTENGFLFQQRAKEILQLADKAKREMAEAGALVGGVVSVACVESLASRLLAELLYAFRARYPYVQYELYSADGNDIREKLDRGGVDLGILLEPVEAAKYDFFRLPVEETWGVMMRADDPLAKEEALSVDALLRLPLIVPRRRIVIDEIARWLGVPADRLRIAAAHNLLTNALPLVARGVGYTICVEGSYTLRRTDEFCFRPLAPRRTTGHLLAWKKNRAFPPATKKFLAFAREAWAPSGPPAVDKENVR